MCSAFVSPDGLKNDEYHICSASFRVMALKTTNVTCVARLFRLMAERYFLSLANWPPGGSDRLFSGRTVSIGSDQVCLPRSSTPLAPVNLLLPVPLIKRFTPVSGSRQNRTQSASWWRQPDSGRVYWTCMAACIKNKWNEISNNETRFTFTEWFQNFSTNGTSRENIHETFGGLLTLYLNSHSVTGRLEFFVGQVNFVSSTLISLQCKDCNFCSCSIDVFLNATLVNTIWNHCVEVYVMFDQNSGGRAAGELKDKSVKRSIKVVLPYKGDIVTFQNIKRIWRSFFKWWSWFYQEKENKYYVNIIDLLTS